MNDTTSPCGLEMMGAHVGLVTVLLVPVHNHGALWRGGTVGCVGRDSEIERVSVGCKSQVFCKAYFTCVIYSNLLNLYQTGYRACK